MRFIDEIRAVLRDATHDWHTESAKELTRRFQILSDKDQGEAREALERAREGFREIKRLYGKVH